MYTSTQDQQVENAIKFLVKRINESGHNPKPVILHSIRVGLHLYNAGYATDTVIAAILHDLLEDTETNLSEIKTKFGPKVAQLVESTTFDQTMLDKTERYKKNFDRACEIGREALIIRTADLLDNSNYYHLTDNNTQRWLYEKLKYFLDVSKKLIGNEVIYKELVDRYAKLTED